MNCRLGITSCDLRRNVADIMFLNDILLNGLIYSPELLSHIGFNI